MGTIGKTLAYLSVLFILSGLVLSSRTGPSLHFFILKGPEGSVEAYDLSLGLSGKSSSLRELDLTGPQRAESQKLLSGRSSMALSAFAGQWGKWMGCIAIPGGEDLPVFVGGGWRGLLSGREEGEFDDMTWADRAYLAFRTSSPEKAPALPTSSEASPGPSPGPSVDSPSPIPTRPPAGVLRVEILNGCGIKGAADWAAKRIQGPGIALSGTGNADHFHYPKTLIRSSAGRPIALEEAAERIGLAPDSIEASDEPSASVDVIVVIGADYRKLRRKGRDGNQH